jgi:hypothetical protein
MKRNNGQKPLRWLIIIHIKIFLKRSEMIKRHLIITAFILSCFVPALAQVKNKENVLIREVTLYNPYKPSLPEVKKRSFLPEIIDTIRVKPVFSYDVKTKPFIPSFDVSQVKPAALVPESLPSLYKTYLKIGLGNYLTPLAEISITNGRSKKGTIGFYGRHFSSNGNIELQNNKKVFAGYMDNDATLYGSKTAGKTRIKGSVDLIQKTRYAYGYDTSIVNYSPERQDIAIGYTDAGARLSISSLSSDSSRIHYDFNISCDYFYNVRNLYQNSAGISGMLARSYNGFYIGSGLDYGMVFLPARLLSTPKYLFSVSPFLRKSSDKWNFKLGAKVLLDKNMTDAPELHLYPDIDFGFSIVPSYISFFAGLSGKLEQNTPLNIISDNPYLLPNGTLFTVPNTDHKIVVSAGLRGNNGIGGNYVLSTSYSLINNMLFYSNVVNSDTVTGPVRGNFFSAFTDDAEILNIHGEMNGSVTDKITFSISGDYYNYNLTANSYAWNKPSWKGKFGLSYNMAEKIFAGMEISAMGERHLIVNGDPALKDILEPPAEIKLPVHLNMNLSAEYRYTKVLSFWTRLYNISDSPYFEWAFYPSQRFLFMIGFTYSL